MQREILRGRTVGCILMLAMLAGCSQMTRRPSAPEPAGATIQPPFHSVELTKYIRKRLDQYKPTEVWGVVPRGIQTMAGVPFFLEGKIELTGLGTARADNKYYPSRLTAIPVGRKGNRLHILTGTGYTVPDGTPITKLVLRYEDGTQYPFYMLYGVHTRNWDVRRSEKTNDVSDPNTVVAWTYKNESFDLRIFKTALDNPYPDRKIQSIDLYSMLTLATPCIVAMTLEENASISAKPVVQEINEAAYRQELLFRCLHEQTGNQVAGAQASMTLTDTNRTYNYGTNRANARGEIVVDYPTKQVQRLKVVLRALGYVTKQFVLTNAEPDNLPKEFVAKLDAGQKMSGIVRNPSGKPIPAAKVSINLITKDEVGQAVEEEIDAANTDRDGKWSVQSLPRDVKSLTFKLSHEEYRPAEYYLATSATPGPEEIALSDLSSGKAKMQMEPALVIHGKVLDPKSKPLADCEVLLRDNAEVPTTRFARTDASGYFKFLVMEAGDGIVAAAPTGLVPQSQVVSFDEVAKPLKFKLQPGKLLKGRIVDQQKNPVSGAKIVLSSWNDLPFPKWRSESDSDGRFQWDSAPAEGAIYSIQKDGYLPFTLQDASPGESEIVITLNSVPSITGMVVDAETKEPIEEFQVYRGRVYSPDEVSWDRSSPIIGRNGKFLSRNSDSRYFVGERIRLLVEANGYLPQASPPVSERGWITNNFVLKKGEGPKGVVKMPNGTPAKGAQVVLVTGEYISLKDKKIEVRSSGLARGGVNLFDETADEQGRFSFPAAYATGIVALNEQGYAEVKFNELPKEVELKLQPWGGIEGEVKNGRMPASNTWVMVSHNGSGISGADVRLSYDFESYRLQSDDQGKFVFNNVPPGQRYLVRLFRTDRNTWQWSHIQPFAIKAGDVTKLVYGGKGRAVVGKLIPTDTEREMNWSSGHQTFHTRMPKPPTNLTNAEQREAWYNTPEYKEARAKYRYFAVSFESDGLFRIDEIPPGQYSLSAYFNESSASGSGSGRQIASLNLDVDVPAGDGPYNLGALELVIKKELKPGAMAPEFEVKTFDGKTIKLSDYRGKNVLLVFWYSMGPGKSETPTLQEVWKKFGANRKFAMIGLNLNPDREEAETFIKKNDLSWPQGYLGRWGDTKLPDRYGVSGVPAVFLIDPTGKAKAVNLRGAEILSAVEEALK